MWNRLRRLLAKKSRSSPVRLRIESLEDRAVPAAFTTGDLVIYRVGDGGAPLVNTGNAVYLDEYTPSGTLVQTIALPTTASGSNLPLIAGGTATSEGFLTLSADGQYALLTGYDSTLGNSGSLSTSSVPRVVGRVDVSGNIDTSTALTDFATGGSPRGVASTNGTDIWLTGAAGGVRYTTLGSTTSTQLSTTVTNLRAVEIFDGQLYVSDSSGTAVRLGTVGTGTPTTSGQTITNLPGFPTAGSPYAFFFADLDAGVTGVDTLYVTDDTAGITKYSLVSGSWVSNGTVGTAADAYRDVTGVVSGTTITLYATRKGGSGAAGGGEFVSLTDTSGYNGAFSATPTLLATAIGSTAFRGIAFAPNAAPVLSGANNFSAINEDDTTNSGTKVSDLINGKVSDASANPVQGIAVTAVDTAHGSWQYTTDGTNWTNVGSVSDSSALLLPSDSKTALRFVPNADFNGTVSNAITFRAWDQSSGTAGSKVDLTATGSTGGGTAFSTATASASITVNSVNDAPSGADKTVTTAENIDYVFTAADFGFTDPNDTPANALLAVKITTLPGAGTLKDNGTAVSVGDFIPVADITGGKLTFTPATDETGNGYATFTFQVQDDGGTANSGVDLDQTPNTITINVTAVNHAPAGADKTVTTLEDTDYVFTAADFGFTDPNDTPANALLAVKITTLPAAGTLKDNGTAVTAGDFITVADITGGKLTFTPAPNANGTGYATFTFQVQDDGGTSFGGVDLDQSPNTITVNVTSVNDAPTLTTTGTNPTFTENGSAVALFTGTAISTVETGQNIDQVVLTVSNVTDGAAEILVVDGTDVALTDGNSVSTTNGLPVTVGVTGSTATVTLTVPGGLPSDIVAGGIDALTYRNSSENPTAGTRVVTLTSVRDTGGTANGGQDTTSLSIASTITVVAVNDAPSGADKTVTTLEDTPYTFATADFGFTDIDANALKAVKITTLPSAGTLTNDGTAVSAGDFISASDITGGKLTFTPATNVNGTGYASFTFQVQDDGGTSDGGVDTDSTPNTITVDVTSVNDAPSGTDQTRTIDEDTSYTFNATEFGFSDPNDTPANTLLALQITTLPGAGSLTFDGNAVTAGQVIPSGQIGLLKFTPGPNEANFFGYATFTFQLQDNGGTANGGVDLDQSPNNFVFNVRPVNDAPVVTLPGGPVSYTENDAPIVIDATATVTDIDSGNFDSGSLTITFTSGGTDDDRLGIINQGTGFQQLGVSGNTVTYNNGVGAIIFGTFTGGVGTTPLVFQFNGAAQVFIVETLLRNITYSNVSDNPSTAPRTLQVVVVDDFDSPNNTSTPVTTTVNVTAVNNAPEGTDKTVTTLEDTAYTFTTADFGFTDIDANSLLAVQITTLPTAGTLTNDGTAVSAGDFISVADITGGKLTFTPDTNANGVGYASFTFQVQDDGGTANTGVDLDQTPNTITIDVTSVNDAPSGTDKTVTTLEDTDYVFTTADFGFSDPNDTPANNLLAVQITTLPGAGTLTNNGVAVTAGDFISASDISGGKLQFTPATDANGTGYATFTFQVQDDGGTSDGGVDLDSTPNTITIDVTSVNDAPSGTDKTVTTLEDTDYTFTAADFGFSDPNDTPANSSLAVKITTLPTAGTLANNGIAVSVGDFISVADITGGKLTFTPAANANGAGSALFTFQVQDNGGTANGGVDLDQSPNTITINVTAVNDPPIGTSGTVTTLEDTPYVFGVADFGFTDPNDTPANNLLAVKITTLPGAGTLTDNGVAVNAGDFIPVADITGGKLTFTPDLNANGAGYASFTFQVQDDGGGTDLELSPKTITIDVTAVNDKPNVVLAGNVTVSQNSGTFTQNGFATFSPGGGPDEATQTATYLLTNTFNALFSSQPVIDASGKLSFTLAPGVVGTAIVTVHASDSGASAAPNDNVATTMQFKIIVNALVVAAPVAVQPVSVAASSPTTPGPKYIAIGSDAGTPSRVQILDATNGALLADFSPFGAYSGGVRVAIGDLNGDGTDDIILASAGTMGMLELIDGRTGAMVGPFMPFGNIPSGLEIALGDIDGDGRADLLIGMQTGGSSVMAITSSSGIIGPVDIFPGFTGGVRLALGDVNGDGRADLVFGTGPGGGGQVFVFDGVSKNLIGAFTSHPGFPGEVNLALGDINGDGKAEILTAVAQMFGTEVDAFTPQGGLVKPIYGSVIGASTGFVRSTSATGTNQSARIATADVNGDNIADILIGSTTGNGASRFLILDGVTGNILANLPALDPLSGSGVSIDVS